MSFIEIMRHAVEIGASDVFIISGREVSAKVGKSFVKISEERVMPDASRLIVEEAYVSGGRDITRLQTTGDDDFAISVPGLARMRMSAFKQRGSLAAVVRIVSFGIPDYKAMGIPENVMNAVNTNKGLVLVTGAAGSGKSTTLACMIDRINKTREGHIITLEDPIEFLYRNDKSIITQREIEIDTKDYVSALRACLRQAPDVILLGEMRDYETIKTAMTAAETGHLILSTLHTLGAGNTVDRIIDIFPPNQQQQIRVQLAMLLHCVVSQQLVSKLDGGVVPVFEVMYVNGAIRNMIRDAKIHQIDAVISTAAAEGMQSMDAGLYELYKKGVISEDSAITCSVHPEIMEKRLRISN